MPSSIFACHMSFGPGATALIISILAGWLLTAILILPNLIFLLTLKMSRDLRRKHSVVFALAVLWALICFIEQLPFGDLVVATGALGIPFLVITQFCFLFILRSKLRRELALQKPEDIHTGPRCAACEVPIQTGLRLCPACGWTQPE